MMKKMIMFLIFVCGVLPAHSQMMLIPMDLTQTDHLKSYGAAYWGLQNGVRIEWLLNYSFALLA